MSSIGPLSQIFSSTILFAMPRSAVNLYRFRNEIENQLLVQHRTQKEVLSWLASEGVPITIDILKARHQSRQAPTGSSGAGEATPPRSNCCAGKKDRH